MNTIIVSGPVIIEDNKVLLVKHGEDKFWKFPGGRIEEGDFKTEDDILENACKREVKEELGIEIEIVRPLKPMIVRKDEDTNVILLHYLAERVGDVNVGDDVLEFEWIDADKLPEDVAENVGPVLKSMNDQ